MSETIDICKELDEIWENHEGFTYMEVADLIESMLKRVEESTIQRCYRILMTEQGGIPRLYSPKPDGEVK